MFNANELWKKELREKRDVKEEKTKIFSVNCKNLSSKRKQVEDCTLASKNASRISKQEKTQWDKRVRVCFQPNAWCDQQVMKDWIQNDWNSVFCNPATPGSFGKLLLADIHRAQQTPEVKTMLAKCKTQLVNIPGGLTAYLQVLDVGVNKSFKYVFFFFICGFSSFVVVTILI